MTTSFENLTPYKLNIFTPTINSDINPNEILDIDTSNVLEGTLKINIRIKQQIIWEGFIPIKTTHPLQIYKGDGYKFHVQQKMSGDNVIPIPNILKENFEFLSQKEKSFLEKNKFKIFLFLFILIILFLIKKYYKINLKL